MIKLSILVEKKFFKKIKKEELKQLEKGLNELKHCSNDQEISQIIRKFVIR